MANPQPDQYTKISNEFLDKLYSFRIPGEERLVFDFIIRKTWGFGKKEDNISLNQFVEKTGLKKPSVCRSLAKLLTHKLISKTANKNNCKYGIQKDFDKWIPFTKVLISISKTANTISRKANDQTQNNQPQTLAEVLPTKEIKTLSIKETFKNGLASPENNQNHVGRIPPNRHLGVQSIQEMFSSDTRVSTQSQSECLRMMEKIGVDFKKMDDEDESLRGRIFGLFKDAYQQKNQIRLQVAYSFLFDHSRKDLMSNKEKVLLFMWRYHNNITK